MTSRIMYNSTLGIIAFLKTDRGWGRKQGNTLVGLYTEGRVVNWFLTTGERKKEPITKVRENCAEVPLDSNVRGEKGSVYRNQFKSCRTSL